MTDQQKELLRQTIEDLIPSIESEVARLTEQVRPIAPDRAIGRLTRMEAISEKSIKEANLRSAKTRLSAMHAMLQKMDDSDFGYCAECGEEIPFKRLLARPESRLCVECAV